MSGDEKLRAGVMTVKDLEHDRMDVEWALSLSRRERREAGVRWNARELRARLAWIKQRLETGE